MEIRPSIGKIEFIKGSASLKTASWVVPLEKGSPVYEGGILITHKGSTVKIRFHDNSLLRQSENSRLVIDRYVYDPDNGKKSNRLFGLPRGTFQFTSGSIDFLEPENLNIKTPSTLMGVRGTGFSVCIGPKGEEVRLL